MRRRRRRRSDDATTRWELSADFASAAVQLWLEADGRTLEDVLAKSLAFGHDKLNSGVILGGRLARQLAAGGPGHGESRGSNRLLAADPKIPLLELVC